VFFSSIKDKLFAKLFVKHKYLTLALLDKYKYLALSLLVKSSRPKNSQVT